MLKKLLHVGCGEVTMASLKGFTPDEWEEVRFDINPDVKPDIIGTVTDLSAVPDSYVSAIYSAHNVEHVYPHEVLPMLQEFFRVLKPDGFLVVTCPDLQSVFESVLRSGLLAPLYHSEGGDITALDVLYGHIQSVAAGNEYMAHKCGFTHESLASALYAAGFKTQHGGRIPRYYELWQLAFKSETPLETCQQFAKRYLP